MVCFYFYFFIENLNFKLIYLLSIFYFCRQTQKVVAELVASEFYQQGDIEKEQLNIEPIVSKINKYH